MPDRKINQEMPSELFRATVANADTKTLKSFRTLFDTYLVYMLAEFEENRMVQNVQNFELFDQKRVF